MAKSSNDVLVSEDEYAAFRADSDRLDWLEAEMEREHRTTGYRSLFRRNVPITREAIDEMMNEKLPGDSGYSGFNTEKT